MKKKRKKYSDEVQTSLKTIFDDCINEDKSTYENQIRRWRQLKLLWDGFQQIWFSEVAHDWRVYDESNDSDEQSYYDKPINVFKAYLESIVAALSITIPPIRCYPDNADDTLDLSTARAGDKISQLIYRHNDVTLLWLHALFLIVTEGMVAGYTYPDTNEEYGTYDENHYRDDEETHQITSCPDCGYTINDELASSDTTPVLQPPSNPMVDEQSGQPVPQELNPQESCPACGNLISPQIQTEQQIVTKLVGVTQEPKSRVCMECYGGLNIKIPTHAKKQKDCTYLIFSEERDYTLVLEDYDHLTRDEKTSKIKNATPGAYTDYPQWGRLPSQYRGEFPENVVTVNKAWIRPSKFNILNDETKIKELKKQFPKGVQVTFVNEQFCEAEPCSLDDYWTLTENPLSSTLHFEPLGQSVVSIQDITGDIIPLVLQTIEHGIGQTFADPAVLDFKQYGETEVQPGSLYPAKSRSGKPLGDGFYELKTATLSGEVLPFFQTVQSLGQISSGALPSLFGGQLEGSETASQYSMSRAQALQRLQNSWKMLTIWWKNVNGKAIPLYISLVRSDERDVQKDKDGNFINVVIHQAELQGKIGKVELEANENLPITWSQRRDIIEKLLTAGNPQVMAFLQAPENLSVLHEYLGLDDFYIPGEDDIIQQYDEIKLLLQSQPIETGDRMNPESSSVPIDPIFDNNQIGFEIVRKWAISVEGRQTKTDNEAGYRNVLLHGKEHFMAMQQMAMQQAQNQAPPEKGAVPGKKPNSQGREAPITGDSNVATIQ
jgi:hypothetical protein